MTVGAFVAIASSPHVDVKARQRYEPARLTLPAAVLCHFGHRHDRDAVAVAVPSLFHDSILIEGVAASNRWATWVMSKVLRVGSPVSITADLCRWSRPDEAGVISTLEAGWLTGVDFVDHAADRAARVVAVRELDELDEFELETRDRLDSYLSDVTNLGAIDVAFRAKRCPDFLRRVAAGESALGLLGAEALAEVVAPLVDGRTRDPRCLLT